MHLTTPALTLNSTQASSTSTPAEIDRVSREFESVFAKMMIASMRQASPENTLFPGENTLYRDMYDQQLARSMSQGKGLGLAPIIRRQLEGHPAATPIPVTAAIASRAYSEASCASGPASNCFPFPTGDKTPAWLPLRHDKTPLDLRPSHVAVGPIALRGADLALRATALSSEPAEPASHDEFAIAVDAADGLPSIYDQPFLPPSLAGTHFAETEKAAAANKRAAPHSAEEFVAAIWPQAQRAAAELGISPRILVAQAALETGWGKRSISRDGAGNASANNLFGIKATGGWQGEKVNRSTTEVVNGVSQRERADFRAYNSISDSFNDYVRLLKQNRRYDEAVAAGTDHRRFANEIAKAGYATDPQYAAKLVAIAEGPTLRRALAPLADNMVAMR